MTDTRKLDLQIKALEAEHGRSAVLHAMKQLQRERVNSVRDPRKSVPHSLLSQKWRNQRGICGICRDTEIPMILKKNLKHPYAAVADHIDPNRRDFNNPENIQAAHSKCNAEKAHKSPHMMSKQTGRTVTEQLEEVE